MKIRAITFKEPNDFPTPHAYDTMALAEPTAWLGGYGNYNNRYQIRWVDGFSPGKAVLSTEPYSGTGGTVVTGSRLDEKNLVFAVKLNPRYALGETVESIREDLSTLLRPGRRMTLMIWTISDGWDFYSCDGYLEGVEFNIFSKEDYMQIAFKNPSGIFKRTNANTWPFSVSLPSEATTGSVTTNYTYLGKVDAGFKLRLKMEPTYPTHRLKKATITVNGKSMVVELTDAEKLVPGSGANDGVLEINTEFGSRYVISGASTNRINRLRVGDPWLYLRPGNNTITVALDAGGAHKLQQVDCVLTSNVIRGGF